VPGTYFIQGELEADVKDDYFYVLHSPCKQAIEFVSKVNNI
jgi:hypothetical protein